MNYQLLPQQIYASLRSGMSARKLSTDVIALMRTEAAFLAGGGNSSIVAQRHPLGFFACRWPIGESETLRLHLWDKRFEWAQEPGWEIHDHVFSFSSVVLLGSLQNCIYEIDEAHKGPGHQSLYEVAYDGATSSMRAIRSNVSLEAVSDATESFGSRYEMESGVLHASRLLSDRAVTLLATRADGLGYAPRVVSPHRRGIVAFDRSPTSSLETSSLLTEYANQLERLFAESPPD